ncbi:uncharacterized protein [Typha angustifolia]|uniref:uncharacterized protein isoform X2 n=1 Tax=Typha angustifolia TaxID=59011 RepID=UPI003C2F709F
MDPVGGGRSLPPTTTTSSVATVVSSSLSPLAPPFTLERRLPSSASSDNFTFWLDPSSSYHTSSSLPREIYGGYVTAPGNTSGAPVLVSTGLHEVESYPRLLITSSVVEPSSAFLSNSSFDTSTNTMDYIASTSCSNSGLVITSAIRTSSSNGYCASDAPNPMVNQLSPHSMDTYNSIAKMQQSSINHNSIGSKLGYNDNIQDDNKLTRSIYISGKFGQMLHSSSKVATKDMADYATEVTSGLKMKHLVPKASASTCGSVLSNDQKQNSLERVDSLDQDVDSPCWKGTLVSRQSPFSVGEQPSPYPVVKESEGSNDLSPEQKHLSSSAIYCESVAEQSSTFVSSKSDQMFSASAMVLSSIISPRVKKISEEAGIIKPDCPNSCGKAIFCADICQEQRIEDKKRNAEVNYNDAAESDPKGPCSSREKHIQVLVKAMHSLSEMLLGTICNGDDRLVEQDNKLLHLVIDNLQILLHENNKDTSPAM